MTAARKLEAALAADPAAAEDPVLQAFLTAPLSEEPETEEEREADMAAIAEYRAGRSRAIEPAEMRSILERVRVQEQGG